MASAMTPTTVGDARSPGLAVSQRTPGIATVIGLVGLVAPLRALVSRGGDTDGIGLLIPGLLLLEVAVFSVVVGLTYQRTTRQGLLVATSDFAWPRWYFAGALALGIVLCAAPLIGYSWVSVGSGLLLAVSSAVALIAGTRSDRLQLGVGAVSVALLIIASGIFLVAPVLYAAALVATALATARR